MKNTSIFKVFSLVAAFAAIGFSAVSCDNDPSSPTQTVVTITDIPDGVTWAAMSIRNNNGDWVAASNAILSDGSAKFELLNVDGYDNGDTNDIFVGEGTYNVNMRLIDDSGSSDFNATGIKITHDCSISFNDFTQQTVVTVTDIPDGYVKATILLYIIRSDGWDIITASEAVPSDGSARFELWKADSVGTPDLNAIFDGEGTYDGVLNLDDASGGRTYFDATGVEITHGCSISFNDFTQRQ